LDETIRREEGLLYLDPEPAALALYGDCDAVTRAWAIGQVTPQTLASFRSPRTSQSIDVATTYVICERDQALLPEVQEKIAERCDDVVTLYSDHSPFLSRPREFADLLASLGFGA
jgi:pimeloyl-ACP methyl ester carboxylesterase